MRRHCCINVYTLRLIMAASLFASASLSAALISRLHHFESTQTHPPRTSRLMLELTLPRPPQVKFCLCFGLCVTVRRVRVQILFSYFIYGYIYVLFLLFVFLTADRRLAHLPDCNTCRARPCLYLLFKHRLPITAFLTYRKEKKGGGEAAQRKASAADLVFCGFLCLQ